MIITCTWMNNVFIEVDSVFNQQVLVLRKKIQADIISSGADQAICLYEITICQDDSILLELRNLCLVQFNSILLQICHECVRSQRCRVSKCHLDSVEFIHVQ